MKDSKATVVRIGGRLRCIYINDFRVAGGKPYISEGGSYEDIAIKPDNLFEVLPDEWRNAIIDCGVLGNIKPQRQRDRQRLAAQRSK